MKVTIYCWSIKVVDDLLAHWPQLTFLRSYLFPIRYSSVVLPGRPVIAVAVVLVTGAAGTLGNVLVSRLIGQRHQVRVLLHHRSAGFPPEVQVARGNVRCPADLAEAVNGVDTVIHAATSPFRQATATEVEGTRAVLAAAGPAGAHVVYPSIVGVDRLGGTYYRAKWEAEQLVAASSHSTIQRATQLHPTLDKMLSHRAPGLPATRRRRPRRTPGRPHRSRPGTPGGRPRRTRDTCPARHRHRPASRHQPPHHAHPGSRHRSAPGTQRRLSPLPRPPWRARHLGAVALTQSTALPRPWVRHLGCGSSTTTTFPMGMSGPATIRPPLATNTPAASAAGRTFQLGS